MSQKYPEWYELPAKRWRNNPDKLFENDSQRQKLYDAEHYVTQVIEKLEAKSAYPFEFNSIEEVQKFVNKLTSSVWFRKRWGNHQIRVYNTSGTWARGNSFGYIKLPFRNRWSRSILVILHEISHCIRKHGSGTDHGRFFARTLLELVEHVVGKRAAKILKEAFKRGRVKYLPKRELSEETREKLRQNFINNVLKQKVGV